ncbi:sll1863 family stress response protein [Halomonas koreensis]|uniref:Uncharacterized protein n=1 Tax=Halomonas koreensis TaxID=245385 RepID=A0ABU1FYC6_9GAMM|nr:hypothetical protein [Halomonas koreensis]MDR5865174.1 hypothetical protein [Halomonas koreensis]
MRERDDVIERFKASLDDWNAEIERLGEAMRRAGARTQARHAEDLARLKRRRDEARRRLEARLAAGEEARDDLRQGGEAAWARLRRALRDAASRFE